MIYFKNIRLFLFAGILSLIFGFVSCETEKLPQEKYEVFHAKTTMGTENARFPTFHHNFNDNLGPWVDNSIEGELGWCGSIELADRKNSDISPSAGRGFAILMNGTCNDYYTEQGFETSGPATFDPALWGMNFPESGFIHQLDIYLDPGSFESGAAFTYANSLFYEAADYPFRYFSIDVTKTEAILWVEDYQVSENGWYTFRHVNSRDDEGNLKVDFELLKNGKVLYSTSIDQTLLTAESTTSFLADGLGSGYIWFVSIQEGVSLPVDEYFLRPGK
ncbi:hypothetical protein [Salegentibacter flavus]|nr:hypothetical protein [Salegentibacter flavus]